MCKISYETVICGLLVYKLKKKKLNFFFKKKKITLRYSLIIIITALANYLFYYANFSFKFYLGYFNIYMWIHFEDCIDNIVEF
jgi:O-antigen/teichoic acid export membrane protein